MTKTNRVKIILLIVLTIILTASIFLAVNASFLTATAALPPYVAPQGTIGAVVNNGDIAPTTPDGTPVAPDKKPWIVTTAGGVTTYQSNIKGQKNATTTFTFTANVTNECYVALEYKVFSERNCDKFNIICDGVGFVELKSGEVDWTTEFYKITAGAHTFSVTYSKDNGIDNGQDCAWVRNIRLLGTGALEMSAVSTDSTLGSVTGSGAYEIGKTATFTAVPIKGNGFVQWEDETGKVISTDLTITVQVLDITTYKAIFYKIPAYVAPQGTVGEIVNDATNLWTITTTGGVTTYQSATAGKNNTTTTLTFTANVTNECYVAVEYKVSSERNWDTFNIVCDGVGFSTPKSNEVDWTTELYKVASGAHTFSISYAKDNSGSTGQDCAWVRNIRLVGTGAKDVSVVSSNSAFGSVTGSGTYEIGKTAKFTATPTSNTYRFIRWEDETGNIVSDKSELNVVINSISTYTAVFYDKAVLDPITLAYGNVSTTVTGDVNTMQPHTETRAYTLTILTAQSGNTFQITSNGAVVAAQNGVYQFVMDKGHTLNKIVITVSHNGYYDRVINITCQVDLAVVSPDKSVTNIVNDAGNDCKPWTIGEENGENLISRSNVAKDEYSKVNFYVQGGVGVGFSFEWKFLTAVATPSNYFTVYLGNDVGSLTTNTPEWQWVIIPLPEAKEYCIEFVLYGGYGDNADISATGFIKNVKLGVREEAPFDFISFGYGSNLLPVTGNITEAPKNYNDASGRYNLGIRQIPIGSTVNVTHNGKAVVLTDEGAYYYVGNELGYNKIVITVSRKDFFDRVITIITQVDLREMSPSGDIVSYVNDATHPWMLAPIGGELAIVSSSKGAGGSTATVDLTINVANTGLLVFEYFVSSESNWDKFTVLLDGQPTSYKDISGEVAWIQAQLNVTQGQHILTLKYVKDGSGDGGEDCAKIRGLVAVFGNKLLTFGASNPAHGSVTAKDSAGNILTSGSQVAAGSKITFTATPSVGGVFCGFVDASGHLVTQNNTYSFVIAVDTNYTAVFGAVGQYVARIDGTFFESLETALTTSKSGDTVLLLSSATISSNCIVKAGVNLIIPFDAIGAYYAEGNDTTAQNRVSWSTPALIAKYRYLTVTINSGVTLTINGNLYVGGTLHYPDQSAQGHTSGAYSELINNGNIEIPSGGVMNVYGRVTGSGRINAQSGSKIYQPFMICDYAGGTNTQGLFDVNQTPFNRYAMVNIENTFTINYGAELWGHASLFFWGSVTTIDTPFITYKTSGSTALIILQEPTSYATISYDNAEGYKIINSGANTEDVGKTTIVLSGGANAGYMQFPLGIDTSKVYFAVPYNFAITLKKGNYDIKYAYKFLPGSSLTVDADATLTVSSGLYIYNGLAQSDISGKSYPTTAKLMEKGYKGNSNFINNGNFVVGANATFGGIIQTNSATAKITTSATAKLVNTGVFDGGTTPYDCNKSVFDLPAQTYVGGKVNSLRAIIAGKSYTANSKDTAWTLPSYTTKYAINTVATDTEADPALYASSYKLHHKYTPITTISINVAMVGSWVEEHTHTLSDYIYVKTSTATEKGERYRTCTHEGCEHREASEILPIIEQNGFTGVFENKALSTFALGEGFRWAEPTTIPTCNVTQYKAIYNGKLTNNQDYVYMVTITLSKRDITITVNDQTAIYNATNRFNTSSYTVVGSFLTGDDTRFGAVLQLAGAGIETGSYTYTLTHSNDAYFTNNYNIIVAYASSRANGVFTVTEATPIINTAPTASELYIGQTLSSSTLNSGLASVNGAFAWEDGTFKPTVAGDFTRSVVFTPTDTHNYKTVKMDVIVKVTQLKVSLTYGVLGEKVTQRNVNYNDHIVVNGANITINNIDVSSEYPINVVGYSTATTADFVVVAQGKSVVIKYALNTPTVTLTADRNNIAYDGNNITLTASATHTIVGATYTYAWYKDGALLANTASSFAVKNVSDSGKYSVKVTAKVGAYSSDATAEVTLMINRAQVDVSLYTFADLTIVYDGQPHSVTVSNLNALVTVAYADNTLTNVGVKTAKVTFTLTDTANYEFKNSINTKTATLTVNKATPTYTAPTFTNVYIGQMMADSMLVGGVGDGAFSIDNKVSFVSGVNNVSVTFKPANANYNSVTFNVSVTPIQLYVTLVDDTQVDRKIAVAYGGTLDKTAYVPLARTGYSVAWDNVVTANITSDITVTAVYTANTYTITYDLVGGVAGASAPTTHTYDSPSTVSNPTKLGYTFVGWLVNGAGNSVKDLVLGAKDYTANIALTANWTINKYTLTIVSSNGIVTGSESGSLVDYNKELTLTAMANIGYIFAGWYVGDIQVGINANYTFTMPAGNKSVEARFTAETNIKYTVEHYQQNLDKTYSTTPIIEELYGVTGTTVTAQHKTYSGFTYDVGSVSSGVILGNGTLVLKLYYTRNSYNLTYVDNGVTNNESRLFGETITLPTITRVGYTFVNWSNSLGGNVSTPTYTLTASDTTLTAVYTVNTYTISYDLVGGVSGTSAPTTHTYDSPTTISNPTKLGYTFVGWLVNGAGNNVKDLVLGAKDYTANISLTAVYTANTYTITYDLVGGVAGTSAPTTHTYDSPTTVSNPTKLGYTFVGWLVNGAGNNVKDLVLGAKDYTADISLTAVYTANTYTITYDLVGGVSGTSAPTAHTYDSATTISNPSKVGYTFVGWLVNGAGNSVKDLVLGAKDYTANISLVAVYTANTYTITYDLVGGVSGTSAPTTHTYDSATIVSNPSKVGYTFVGWLVNGGTEKHIALTLGAKEYTSNIALTANWTLNTPTVTLTADRNNIVYDGNNITLTANVTSLLPVNGVLTYVWYKGDVVLAQETSGTLTLKNAQDTGTYKVIITLIADGQVSEGNATQSVVITARLVTVTIDNKTSIYGEPIAELTYTVTNVVVGDTLNVVSSTTAKQGSNVSDLYIIRGTYTNSNYQVTFVEGKYSVTKRPLTVVIEGKTSVYGEQLSALTSKITSGSIYGVDNINIVLQRENVSSLSVGTYAIVGSFDNANYAVTFAGESAGSKDGTYSITKRPITVKLENQSFVYNGGIPTVGQGASLYTLQGGLGYSDDVGSIGLSLIATDLTKNAGEYTLTAKVASGNYELTVTTAMLTITARLVTVTIDNKTSTFGEPIAELSYSHSDNIVSGDNFTVNLATNATSKSNVGDYKITATQDNANYKLVVTEGKYTITQKHITVTGTTVSGSANGMLVVVFHKDTVHSITDDMLLGAPDGVSVSYHIGSVTGAEFAGLTNIGVAEVYIVFTADANHIIDGENHIRVTYRVVKSVLTLDWKMDTSYTYNGQDQGSSVSVTYTDENNVKVTLTLANGGLTLGQGISFVNAGEYTFTVVLPEGYVADTRSKSVSISKRVVSLEDLTFEDISVYYDELTHTISIKGNVPETVEVNYFYDDGTAFTNETKAGIYTINAVLSLKDASNNSFAEGAVTKLSAMLIIKNLNEEEKAFVAKVKEIGKVTEESYSKIMEAQTLYNKLATKEGVTKEKEQLDEAIKSYNILIEDINNQSNTAITISGKTIVLVGSIYATLIGIILAAFVTSKR